MSSGRILAAALALAAPLAAGATDAPHDASWAGVGGAINCQSCHVAHFSVGGSLTKQAGNFNLCQSCHLNLSGFGFPWSTSHQASPGTGGRSHRWDALATNLGATQPNPGSADPTEAAMGKRIDGNRLQCSTCHDQHQSDFWPVGGRGTTHVSLPLAPAANNPVSGNLNATLTINAPSASATAKGYLVDVVTAGSSTTARFRLSNDNGVSWFGCSAPGTYVPYVASPSNGCAAGAAVQLNDGANLTVAFGGTALAVGDQWRFYVSYPYLRADNTAGRMCTTCHRDRNQTFQNVEGSGTLAGTGQAITLGTTVFHHPTGQALDANGRGYDRAAAALLDADGSAQVAGTEGRLTNDLVVGAGGVVSCGSCHHPHGADSNSLTEDPR